MNREILRLAIPNILSNLSVPLLSTVDTALMGQLSSSHLAAVGIGSMCFSFIYWNFGFLRMGTTGMTAQAFGAKDQKSLFDVLVRSLFLAIVIALIIWLFQNPIFALSSKLLEISTNHIPIFREYYNVRIWAAPATLMLYVLMGWFFGVQNAIIPLVITVFINIVNIALSYYYVTFLELGAEGVAKGTLYAQYLGLGLACIMLVIFYREKLNFRWLSTNELFENSSFARFLNVNKDIFIRTVFLTAAFAFFYKQSSSMGELVLASNIVLMQFVNWMSYGVDGFAFASESLVGKYFGASDYRQAKKVVVYCFIWALILGLLYSAVYWVYRRPLVRIFTDDLAVRQTVFQYFQWILIIPVAAAASYIWDGVFVGITASKEMRNSMILSFVIYLITYFSVQPIMENHAVWFALTVFLLSRGLIQTWMVRKFEEKNASLK